MNWFAGKSRTITGSGSLTPYSINKALNLALGLFMVFAVAFFIFAGSARAQTDNLSIHIARVANGQGYTDTVLLRYGW